MAHLPPSSLPLARYLFVEVSPMAFQEVKVSLAVVHSSLDVEEDHHQIVVVEEVLLQHRASVAFVHFVALSYCFVALDTGAVCPTPYFLSRANLRCSDGG